MRRERCAPVLGELVKSSDVVLAGVAADMAVVHGRCDAVSNTHCLYLVWGTPGHWFVRRMTLFGCHSNKLRRLGSAITSEAAQTTSYATQILNASKSAASRSNTHGGLALAIVEF